MFIIETYPIVVLFCIITMLCWGSWANTQKLAASNWRFELFYWDYVIGILVLSLLFAFTLGSTGTEGRAFLADFSNPIAEKMSPYTAVVVFAVGILLSNVVFNTFLMLRPSVGTPVSYADYFRGTLNYIWKEFKDAPKGTSNLLNLMLICYALGLIIAAR